MAKKLTAEELRERAEKKAQEGYFPPGVTIIKDGQTTVVVKGGKATIREEKKP